MKSQQDFRRKANNAFTEKVNEIALSVSDGKRIQIYYGIFSYLYGIGSGKVSKAELIEKAKLII